MSVSAQKSLSAAVRDENQAHVRAFYLWLQYLMEFRALSIWSSAGGSPFRATPPSGTGQGTQDEADQMRAGIRAKASGRHQRDHGAARDDGPRRGPDRRRPH